MSFIIPQNFYYYSYFIHKSTFIIYVISNVGTLVVIRDSFKITDLGSNPGISRNLFIYFILISNFHYTTFYLFIYFILISNFHYWILSTFYFLFFFGFIWIMGESRIIVSYHPSNFYFIFFY